MLLSAFPLGYLSTQLLGGWAADLIGPRIVITAAISLSALAMALCGLATSSTQLYWFTVALGVAQGPLFPTSMAYLSKWLPPKERSFAASMLDTGISVGSLIALPLSGALGAWIGWQATFMIYGAMALIFALIWHIFSSDEPDGCWYITPKELAMLKGELSVMPVKGGASLDHDKTSRSNGAKGSGITSLLRKPAIWAIFASHFAFNFSVYFQNSWTPIYYNDVHGISPSEAGLHFAMPHFANTFVKAVVSGPLNAYLLSPKVGFTLKGCRRFFTVVGFLGSSIGLLSLVCFSKSAMATTLWFTVAMGFAAFHPSGFKANYMDVTKHSSGALSGVGNTVATAASYLGPIVVDRLQNSKGWPSVFAVVVSIDLAAAALFGLASTASPLDEPKEEVRKAE